MMTRTWSTKKVVPVRAAANRSACTDWHSTFHSGKSGANDEPVTST
jgi:hypothetical protein